MIRWRQYQSPAIFASSGGGGGGGYTGPGDVVSGATSWWGLRAYSQAKATALVSALDLVDQAGANPTTIAVKSDGTLDTASISSWVTAHSVTTIKVAKIYDQISTNHLSQATLANMPTLNMSGSTYLAFAAASAQTLAIAADLGLAAGNTSFSTASVVERTGSTSAFGCYASFGTFGKPELLFGNSANLLGSYDSVSNVQTVSATDSTWHSHILARDGIASCFNAIDGTSTTFTAGFQASSSPTTMGTDGNGNALDGRVREVGVWQGTLFNGTQTTNLTSNQRTFWSF